MAQKFKSMPACRMSYVQQGIVFFTCQNFRALDDATKDKIRAICTECGAGDGMKRKAILTYMTTRISWRECCDRHYISDATLDRLRRRFYELWKERM